MILIKQKANQKRFKVIDSSSNLLAKHFFDIIETGDLRYLLKLKTYDKLPEYDQSNLLDAWDSVIQEHEKDSGSRNFTNNLISVNYGLKERNRIEGLRASLMLLLINPLMAKELLMQLNFNVNVDNEKNIIESYNKLSNYIKSLQTKLRIRETKNKNKIKYKNPFYDIVYILESELNSFNEENLTLKKMDYLLKNIELKNSKIKELNGRAN